MKRIKALFAALLVFAVLFTVTGCNKKEENPFVGKWEYTSEEIDMEAVYDLKADGTGTYYIRVGTGETLNQIKYETKDNILLVTYQDSDIFSPEDVFENEYRFDDANTLIIKDTFGEELTFIKK